MNRGSDLSSSEVLKQGSEPAPVRYFLPGQIMLHVEHPSDIGPKELADVIASFLSEKTKGQEWKQKMDVAKPDSILTFPLKNKDGLTFSIVPIQLSGGDAGDKDLLARLLDLAGQLKENSIGIQGQISLRAASPNWLVGGAPGQIGTGGPGSWPLPADPPPADNWKFQLVDSHGAASTLTPAGAPDANVHVAILDTMPSLQALEQAYAEFRWGHPLVESLLRPGGPLRTYPASFADLNQVRDYDLRGHRYIMRDHGLFIAGIIHSIAPKATLHLYEVLNPYGVGSLESIARGLLRVLENPEIDGHPLIINCSFMLGTPVRGTSDPDFPVELRDPGLLQQLTWSARQLFDLLDGRGETIVAAAAGNDAHLDANGQPERPDARYPAAFENVVGVGALPRANQQPQAQYRAASYSNLSDTPPEGSYITLGGEAGAGQGVLGIYISEFPVYKEGFLGFLRRAFNWITGRRPERLPRAVRPDRIKYERNLTGWAWWAGTSFATPVISGTLAARYGQAGAAATNAERVQSVLGATFQPGSTSQHEKVFLVKQG